LRRSSQCQHVGDERGGEDHMPYNCRMNSTRLCFSSAVEFEFQDQIEELHRVFQCQKPTVMEIRWAFLDTPQRERLNRSISCFVFQESLDVEVVHLVIEINRRWMADGTLRFAKE
jgi:hypothetical protein